MTENKATDVLPTCIQIWLFEQLQKMVPSSTTKTKLFSKGYNVFIFLLLQRGHRWGCFQHLDKTIWSYCSSLSLQAQSWRIVRWKIVPSHKHTLKLGCSINNICWYFIHCDSFTLIMRKGLLKRTEGDWGRQRKKKNLKNLCICQVRRFLSTLCVFTFIYCDLIEKPNA